MRVGIGSFAFGWAIPHATPPFDESSLLAFARRYRLAVVQIGDNLPVHEMGDERIARLVSAANSAGIALELGARGLTDANLATYLQLCRRCEARLLRFVADANGYRPPPDDLIRLLRNAAPALAGAGITLALENHDRFGAATLRRIVESVGSPAVGICLDTANSLGAGEGLATVTAELAAHTVNLHVKDVAITRLEHRMGFLVEGRILGAGQLPIADAIQRVYEAGRCRSVILEAWTPPCDDLEDTIRKERVGAEWGVEVLKKLVAKTVA